MEHVNIGTYSVLVAEAIAGVVAVCSLSGCVSGDRVPEDNRTSHHALRAAPSGSAGRRPAPPETQSWKEWHAAMVKSLPPKKGCFQAAHPDTRWKEIPCVTRPLGIPQPSEDPRRSAQVSGKIASAIGSFPSVDGVSSVYSNDYPDGGHMYNTYSIQLNTNPFETPACEGQPGCQGWMQFVYNNDGENGTLSIWYMLMGHQGDCGAPFDPPCWKPVGGTPVDGGVPITNLQNVTLQAEVHSDFDWAVLSTGSGNPIYAYGEDSMLGLSAPPAEWNLVEFTVVGTANWAQATFNPGSTITHRIALTMANGSTAAPTCYLGGPTGETNNLGLVPGSCCPMSGSTPTLEFIRSNGSSWQAPFCLLNDITPIQLPLR